QPVFKPSGRSTSEPSPAASAFRPRTALERDVRNRTRAPTLTDDAGRQHSLVGGANHADKGEPIEDSRCGRAAIVWSSDSIRYVERGLGPSDPLAVGAMNGQLL